MLARWAELMTRTAWKLEADRAWLDAAHPGQKQSSQKSAITRATADLAGDGLQEFGPRCFLDETNERFHIRADRDDPGSEGVLGSADRREIVQESQIAHAGQKTSFDTPGQELATC